MYNTISWLRSGIQSNQSKYKLIRLNDGRRGQVGKLVGDKDIMPDVADILSDVDNCLLFKNNVKYE